MLEKVGSRNEAVLRGGFSFFSPYSADTLHIPSAISFAGAVAQPDKLSMEGCTLMLISCWTQNISPPDYTGSG
jgi:hypothetical protein